MEGGIRPEKRRLVQSKRYSPLPARPARERTENPKDGIDLLQHSVCSSYNACDQDEDLVLDSTVTSAFASAAKDNLVTEEDSQENQYVEAREQRAGGEDTAARREELSLSEGSEPPAMCSDEGCVRSGEWCARNDDHCVQNDEDNVRSDEDCVGHDEDDMRNEDCVRNDEDYVKSDEDCVRNNDYVRSGEDYVKSDEDCVRNDDYVRSDEDYERSDEDCIGNEDYVRSDEDYVRSDEGYVRNDDCYVRFDEYCVGNEDSCVRADECCVRNDDYYVRNDYACVRNNEGCVRNEDYYVRNEEDCVRNDEFYVRNEESCVRNDGYHGRNDECSVQNYQYYVGNDDYCVRNDDYCANDLATPEKDEAGHNSRLAAFYENLALGTDNSSDCEYPIQRGGDSDTDSSPETKKRNKNYAWNEPKPQDPKRKRTQDKIADDFVGEQDDLGFPSTPSRKSMSKGKGTRPRSFAHPGRTARRSSFNRLHARPGMSHRESLSSDSDNSRSGDSHSDDPDLQLAMQISRYSSGNHPGRGGHLSPEDAFNMPSTSSSSDRQRHCTWVCSSPDPPSLFPWRTGDLLWARLTGPLWLPCIVCQSHDGYYIQVKVEQDAVVTEYHVQFLDGSSRRCWVASTCLKNYAEAGMQGFLTRRENNGALDELNGGQMDEDLRRRNEHLGHHLDEYGDVVPLSEAEWAQAVKAAREAHPLSREERLHRFACGGHSDCVQDVNGNPAVYAPDFNILPYNTEPQFSDDE